MPSVKSASIVENFHLGAAGYLTKPIDQNRLVAVLNKYRCGSSQCQVLLVEDDDVTREMMRRMLKKMAGWWLKRRMDG